MSKPGVTLDQHGAWIEQARRQLSPNHDQRPAGCEPELIVVHSISLPPGQFGGPHIDQLFCNALCPQEHEYFAEIHQLRVSAHALIRRDGTLVQYVPFTHRAWHAGESSFRGREACNDFSIGVELEGCDDTPFEEIQYQQLASLVRQLWQAWPACLPNPIKGHCDIAPGRKTDPGPLFDWTYLNGLLGRVDVIADHR